MMSLSSVRHLLTGTRPAQAESQWHAEYPLSDTLTAVRMLVAAHRALGWTGAEVPRWWMWQVVVGQRVVGDTGFHGPPDPDGTVEIGYAIVPALRGRGIATAACRRLVARAWSDGARRLVAEVDPQNPASRRVLRSVGFVPEPGEDRFALERP
jgi:RimJ/RimL family protein N-acetyltransferase